MQPRLLSILQPKAEAEPTSSIHCKLIMQFASEAVQVVGDPYFVTRAWSVHPDALVFCSHVFVEEVQVGAHLQSRYIWAI